MAWQRFLSFKAKFARFFFPQSSAPSGRHSSGSGCLLRCHPLFPRYPEHSRIALSSSNPPPLTSAMISRTRQPAFKTVRPGELLGPLRLYSRQISVDHENAPKQAIPLVNASQWICQIYYGLLAQSTGQVAQGMPRFSLLGDRLSAANPY
ncbi:hypothetical protein GGI43DRAFT_350602 [Trichoderma evansii]